MSTPAKQSLELSLDRPDQLLTMAEDLAKFIKENRLSQAIQGRSYVNVEGWQYAGGRLGILPNVEQVTDISKGDEIRYSCTVSLINIRTGAKVGSGFALCSNKENGKRNFQEFAIASMAQTRAIGKAYRNMLAWIIRAAGYEPTPAEEMDYQVVEEKTTKSNGQPVRETPVRPSAKVEKLKEELRYLLTDELITPSEREKAMEGIESFSESKLLKYIDGTKKLIDQRLSKLETSK